MRTYKVALTRTYMVSIKAKSREQAKRFSEFYIGDCPDSSTKKDRMERKFSIGEIEMVYNDAGEVVDVRD